MRIPNSHALHAFQAPQFSTDQQNFAKQRDFQQLPTWKPRRPDLAIHSRKGPAMGFCETNSDRLWILWILDAERATTKLDKICWALDAGTAKEGDLPMLAAEFSSCDVMRLEDATWRQEIRTCRGGWRNVLGSCARCRAGSLDTSADVPGSRSQDWHLAEAKATESMSHPNEWPEIARMVQVTTDRCLAASPPSRRSSARNEETSPDRASK